MVKNKIIQTQREYDDLAIRALNSCPRLAQAADCERIFKMKMECSSRVRRIMEEGIKNN